MHRALPMGKTMDHWVRLSQDLHHSRLKSMKPSIDNKQPKVYTHLQTKKKREQLMLERYAQIEKENRILLEKMAEIMGRPTYPQPEASAVHFKSLNAEARRRRLKKITEENQQILKRIQSSGPNYDHRVWDQHWHNQQIYLKNLCEFPCILLDNDTNAAVKRPLHLDRRSVLTKPGAQSAPLTNVIHQADPDHAGGQRKRRLRRRKHRPATTTTTAPSAKIVLREGRNIEGTYVVVSVLEIDADQNKVEAGRRWQFQVYDPQFADQVNIDLEYDIVVDFAKRRPELLLESKQADLAALLILNLQVDSSSGVLRAGFGADLIDCYHPGYFDSAAIDDIHTDDPYDEDEFGSEADLIALASPPRLAADRPEAPAVILPESESNTGVDSDGVIENKADDLDHDAEKLELNHLVVNPAPAASIESVA